MRVWRGLAALVGLALVALSVYACTPGCRGHSPGFVTIVSRPPQGEDVPPIAVFEVRYPRPYMFDIEPGVQVGGKDVYGEMFVVDPRTPATIRLLAQPDLVRWHVPGHVPWTSELGDPLPGLRQKPKAREAALPWPPRPARPEGPVVLHTQVARGSPPLKGDPFTIEAAEGLGWKPRVVGQNWEPYPGVGDLGEIPKDPPAGAWRTFDVAALRRVPGDPAHTDLAILFAARYDAQSGTGEFLWVRQRASVDSLGYFKTETITIGFAMWPGQGWGFITDVRETQR